MIGILIAHAHHDIPQDSQNTLKADKLFLLTVPELVSGEIHMFSLHTIDIYVIFTFLVINISYVN